MTDLIKIIGDFFFIKEKNRKRKFLTELGELQFERDYYFNKKTGAFETCMNEKSHTKNTPKAMSETAIKPLITVG